MRYLGRVSCVAFIVCCASGGLASANDESCPGKPDAIGTSRTITVDPATLPRIGSMQYKATLPLKDHEVVITLDDGPIPPSSTRVLDVLKENCVKVTYFLVGEMADAYPSLVRRIFNDGHTVGTHSQHHPLAFARIGKDRMEREVDRGIASVKAALGDPRAVAPFFRIPGLARSKQIETFLAAQSLAVWSADEVADDWHVGISADSIVRRAIRRIEANDHRGVLLLHDIHPATARALPSLLKELKSRGYQIVHVVPPGERPKSVPVLPTVEVAKSDTDDDSPVSRRSRHRRATRDYDSFSAALVGRKRAARTAKRYSPDALISVGAY
jgi:peptidoglycan/xylan/chitin deacetylase (PgdA/CDA1 family)